MLEKCLDVYACETSLKRYLPSIRLVGQIPLNESDIVKITQVTQEKLARQFPENIDDVIQNTPTVLACFLVWKGIQDYNEGTYWVSINADIGPIDTTHQVKLGRFFKNFVESNNLFDVEIPDARRYITPILLHGIFPKDMVGSFFDQIVYHLIRKELVNPREESEIEFWLQSKRELVRQLQLAKEVNECEKELHFIKNQIAKCNATISGLNQQLAASQINSNHIATIDEDFQQIRQLNNEYQDIAPKIAYFKENLVRFFKEYQKYQQIGLIDLVNDCDFETFHCRTFNEIIIKINESLESNDKNLKANAINLLDFIYVALNNGILSLPSDMTKNITDLYQKKICTHTL